MPLAIGWLIRVENQTLYIAGDTTIFEGLISALKDQKQIDIGFLPVNEDNFFRRRRGIIGNMSIREAFGLAAEVGIKKVIPVHWDMFQCNSALPEEIKAIYNGYDWSFELVMDMEKI